jgi:hypothetical protein
LIVSRWHIGDAAAGKWPLTPEFDREHLRLLTDKVSEKAADLRTANARLRALSHRHGTRVGAGRREVAAACVLGCPRSLWRHVWRSASSIGATGR